VEDCGTALSSEELAQHLQQVFGTKALRYSRSKKPIRKIAYCSGSGASMLELAAAKGCDGLITGDIKHDRWYAAEFLDVALFDCGHYHTEQMAAELLQKQILGAYPEAEVLCFPGDAPDVILSGGAKQ
jgi:putative NIF3 family GTP cyclohydrolase 1 type 2